MNGMLLLALLLPPDSGAPAPAARTIELRNCEIDYLQASLLGSATMDVLQECLARPGDRVKAGQVLGRLRDQDARAELEMRAAEAESEAEIRLAEIRHRQATGKLKSSESLHRRNILSVDEFNAHKLDAENALLAVEAARFRRRMAQIQLRRAEEAVRMRQIVSPHDGVVAAVYQGPGELVKQSDPIFKVVDDRRFRVVGRLDVADAWRARKGQAVRVSPEVAGADLPVEREVFAGRITFVDNRVEPEDRTCKVVAEVENRGDLLRSGLSSRMVISLDDVADRDPAAAGVEPSPGPSGGAR